jgi:ABC-2 type transport system permease protein
MPAVTFSGFGFPISTMPQWLQYLTYLSPLRYFLVVLRGTYLKGVGLNILWPQMMAMLALGVGLLHGCDPSLSQSARLTVRLLELATEKEEA